MNSERTLRLRTADGVPIVASYLSDEAAADLVFVVGHGFTGGRNHPRTRRIISRLARHGAVLALDFRGHGDSGGRSSVGNTEILDLQAAVAYAREQGHRYVVTVGFSMGGSVAVRHAAEFGGVDAVVSVSGPARWFEYRTPAMRRVHWVCDTNLGRLAAQLVTHTRLGAPWDPIPESPVEAAGRLAVPLLVVHGDADHYFPVDHAELLATAAGALATLWVIPDLGHAEGAVTPGLLDAIATWCAAAVAGTLPIPGTPGPAVPGPPYARR